MDKFTAKSSAGGGGVAVKRTKTVLKSRTYMEGGYMKSVCEEVEVTDDEVEVRRFFSLLFFLLGADVFFLRFRFMSSFPGSHKKRRLMYVQP